MVNEKEIKRLLGLTKFTPEDKISLQERIRENIDPRCVFSHRCSNCVILALRRLRTWYNENK